MCKKYIGFAFGGEWCACRERYAGNRSKSENVDAPVISEYPLTLECKLISYDNETERLIGEVVNTIADDSILTDGKIDLSKFHPITYDCVNHHYIALGEKVGNAFKDGLQLK